MRHKYECVVAIIITNSSRVASDAEITPGLVLTEAGRSETGVLAAKPREFSLLMMEEVGLHGAVGLLAALTPSHPAEIEFFSRA